MEVIEVKKVQTNLPQVIYREGTAPDVPAEKAVVVTGTLKAVGDYLVHKVGEEAEISRIIHDNKGYADIDCQMYEVCQSTVYVSNEDKRIDLSLNEKNFVTDELHGVLQRASIWSELHVNSDHLWNIEGLRRIMKRVKHYFADHTEHSAFLLKLQKFVAKVDSQIKDTKVSGEFEKSVSNILVNGGLIPEFKIMAPVYKGYEKKVVRVEVLADVSDGGVRFSLESQDLFTLEEELAEKYIKDEIKRITTLFNDEISVVNIN